MNVICTVCRLCERSLHAIVIIIYCMKSLISSLTGSSSSISHFLFYPFLNFSVLFLPSSFPPAPFLPFIIPSPAPFMTFSTAYCSIHFSKPFLNILQSISWHITTFLYFRSTILILFLIPFTILLKMWPSSNSSSIIDPNVYHLSLFFFNLNCCVYFCHVIHSHQYTPISFISPPSCCIGTLAIFF